MSPTFSIIIPVYNVAPYLRECLDSVLAQTYTDWEAICVDDGSTDGSGAILDEYAAKDRRFRVRHQKNAGVSVARNAALSCIKGVFTCFVDADDVLDSTFLHDFKTAIAHHPEIDLVRTGWQDLWPDKTVVFSNATDKFDCVLTGTALMGDAWAQIARCGFMVVNAIRSSLIGELRFSESVHYREDALFLFQIIQRCKTMITIDGHGYLYRRIREGSATNTSRRRDASVSLLNAYCCVWTNVPRSDRSDEMIMASTSWICKDIDQWYHLCKNKRVIDVLHVWFCIVRLWANGAFSIRIVGCLRQRVRWVIFLCTAMMPILYFTKQSINPFHKETGK